VTDGIPGQSSPEDADLLRLIFESATDFAVFAEDSAGRVMRWNSGAARLTGYSEQEILHSRRQGGRCSGAGAVWRQVERPQRGRKVAPAQGRIAFLGFGLDDATPDR
jgi:PAS domain-containing protein